MFILKYIDFPVNDKITIGTLFASNIGLLVIQLIIRSYWKTLSTRVEKTLKYKLDENHLKIILKYLFFLMIFFQSIYFLTRLSHLEINSMN